MLAHCYWQRDRNTRPTILGLHGLEGSSRAHYMQGLADKAWAAGFNVVLLNQRNCGGTEHLSSTLYHSGLTADADWVLRELAAEGLTRFGVVGYSLGGNLALKLAGDYGAAAPSFVKAMVAVSPVMDLPRCVDALERRSNFAYQWNFVRNLKGRMRRKVAAFPERFSAEPLDRIRSVRDFDEAYTAPHFGFRDATDYYYRAASLRVVDRIQLPALDHHRRRRSVRAARAVLRSRRDRQPAHHDTREPRTADTARSSQPPTACTTGIGRSGGRRGALQIARLQIDDCTGSSNIPICNLQSAIVNAQRAARSIGEQTPALSPIPRA